MTTCDIHIPVIKRVQVPESQWSLWLKQFNWINYLGLAMFILPVLIGYVGVHYWLLQHDALLYYASLYAQLGLLLIASRQL